MRARAYLIIFIFCAEPASGGKTQWQFEDQYGLQNPKKLDRCAKWEYRFRWDHSANWMSEQNLQYQCSSYSNVLMNSLNTNEDTKINTREKQTFQGKKIYIFNQSRYPRINKESWLPAAKNVSYSGENTEAWVYPRSWWHLCQFLQLWFARYPSGRRQRTCPEVTNKTPAVINSRCSVWSPVTDRNRWAKSTGWWIWVLSKFKILNANHPRSISLLQQLKGCMSRRLLTGKSL